MAEGQRLFAAISDVRCARRADVLRLDVPRTGVWGLVLVIAVDGGRLVARGRRKGNDLLIAGALAIAGVPFPARLVDFDVQRLLVSR